MNKINSKKRRVLFPEVLKRAEVGVSSVECEKGKETWRSYLKVCL
jgi:hypothetical protein